MIALVGGTGRLGATICRVLTDGGANVRALVRPTASTDRLSSLSNQGVELVQGDLRCPTDLRKLCTDARVVISTASAMTSRQPGDSIRNVDEQGHIDLVEAAEQAGVERFIFVSVGPQALPSPLFEAKQQVEQRLRQSKLSFTVVRPAYFMEVWLSSMLWPVLGFDFKQRHARLAGDGQARVNWLSVLDVARYVAGTIDDGTCRNQVMDILGPDSLSPLEIVDLLELASGHKFRLSFVTEAALRKRHAQGDDYERSFASLILSSASPPLVSSRPPRAMPSNLTTVNSYVSRIAKHI